jgi:hypothetical protein
MNFENKFKQFLEDSGSTEDDITQKEMMELQEAINMSKESASIEEDQRKYNRVETQKLCTSSSTNDNISSNLNKDKPFTHEKWTKQKVPIDILDIEKELSTKKEFEITFQDLVEPSGISLKIVCHKPVFNLPIATNQEYEKYTMQERAKLLHDYYTKIEKLRVHLAKSSLHRAPYPKPILSSNKCKNSLIKSELDDENGSTDEFTEEPPPVQDLYISRAGRQIKRKIYTDVEDDSDGDLTYLVKKNKADNPDTKIIMDIPYTIPEEIHADEKTNPKNLKPKKDTQRRLLSTKKPSSRSEALLDKLANVVEHKKQQQEEMDNFEKTLPNLEDMEDRSNSSVEEQQSSSEDNFVRKRVIPPIPGKKGSRAKKPPKLEVSKDKIEIKPETRPESPVLKRYTNLRADIKSKQKAKSPKGVEEGPKVEKRNCPICNKQFLQTEIETHASTCGIEEETTEPLPENSRTRVQSIKCELCDQLFGMNTEYEVHVKQCIAKKITDM